MTTIESNKLIAEFMGCVYFTKSSFSEEKDYWEFREFIPYNGYGRVQTKELAFDSSWDWLMPVVEKIESLKLGDCIFKDSYGNDDPYYDAAVEVKIQHSVCIIDLFGTMKVYEAFIEVVEEESKIKSTYKAVVEFIKWYNSNKDNNE